MVKVPSSVVSAVRTSPVLTLVTLTCALATRASLGSLTVPTMAPLLFWASAEMEQRSTSRSVEASNFLIFRVLLLKLETRINRRGVLLRYRRKLCLLSQRTKFALGFLT